jgi:hypothetical protein
LTASVSYPGGADDRKEVIILWDFLIEAYHSLVFSPQYFLASFTGWCTICFSVAISYFFVGWDWTVAICYFIVLGTFHYSFEDLHCFWDLVDYHGCARSNGLWSSKVHLG